MGNSDYILGFFTHFFCLPWQWSNVGTLSRKVLESPSLEVLKTKLDRALWNPCFGQMLDDLRTSHSAWQGTEQRMKAKEEVKDTYPSLSTASGWLRPVAAAHQWGKAQPDMIGKGRVIGFAAMESFTPARECTHLQLSESLWNLLPTSKGFLLFWFE